MPDENTLFVIDKADDTFAMSLDYKNLQAPDALASYDETIAAKKAAALKLLEKLFNVIHQQAQAGLFELAINSYTWDLLTDYGKNIFYVWAGHEKATEFVSRVLLYKGYTVAKSTTVLLVSWDAIIEEEPKEMLEKRPNSPQVHTAQDIAQVGYESLRFYGYQLGVINTKTWTIAPEWQRSFLTSKAQYILDNPSADARAVHCFWLNKATEAGWTFGEKENGSKKLHPALMEYEKLPYTQRVKEELFLGIVRAFQNAK